MPRGVDEPRDDRESRALQGTDVREEFEERPLRGGKIDYEIAAEARLSGGEVQQPFSNAGRSRF